MSLPPLGRAAVGRSLHRRRAARGGGRGRRGGGRSRGGEPDLHIFERAVHRHPQRPRIRDPGTLVRGDHVQGVHRRRPVWVPEDVQVFVNLREHLVDEVARLQRHLRRCARLSRLEPDVQLRHPVTLLLDEVGVDEHVARLRQIPAERAEGHGLVLRPLPAEQRPSAVGLLCPDRVRATGPETVEADGLRLGRVGRGDLLVARFRARIHHDPHRCEAIDPLGPHAGGHEYE